MQNCFARGDVVSIIPPDIPPYHHSSYVDHSAGTEALAMVRIVKWSLVGVHFDSHPPILSSSIARSTHC